MFDYRKTNDKVANIYVITKEKYRAIWYIYSRLMKICQCIMLVFTDYDDNYKIYGNSYIFNVLSFQQFKMLKELRLYLYQ